MELLDSLEEDYLIKMSSLKELISREASHEQLTQKYKDCELILKQIEVEGINLMADDKLRLKVRPTPNIYTADSILQKRVGHLPQTT